jgi:hypothetical protein
MVPGFKGPRVRMALVVLVLVAACETPPANEFTPVLVVHGLLHVGTTADLTVHVNRTYRIDEEYGWDFGASIELTWRGIVSRPVDDYLDRHYDFRPSFPVRPGDTFEIMVAHSGYDTVLGRTVVPDTFHILYPRNGDTVSLYDSLGWTRSRAAAGYYFAIQRVWQGSLTSIDVVLGNDSAGQGIEYDSTRVNIPSMAYYYGDEPGWKTLTIYAVDRNYYDWMRLEAVGGQNGTPPESTYLVGGQGVFGAAALDSVRFYFTNDTAGRR